MAEIIDCPSCGRKLRMDESVVGQTVKCPSCANAFTAELPKPAPPKPSAPSRADEQPIYRPRDDDDAPRRYDRDERDTPRRRRRDVDDDEDYTRRSRNRFADDFNKPHRGSTIQTLGILSLVFCFCFPLPGLIMAIITIVMGTTDLAAMNRGEMDPAGRAQTKTGLVCGIVAPVLLVLGCITCVGINILNDH